VTDGGGRSGVWANSFICLIEIQAKNVFFRVFASAIGEIFVFSDDFKTAFRIELMLIESFEIGRLDFPNRDTLKSTHCFLLNETELSHGYRRKTIRRECVSVANGAAGQAT
jgi:hypothetical protein